MLMPSLHKAHVNVIWIQTDCCESPLGPFLLITDIITRDFLINTCRFMINNFRKQKECKLQ